MDDNYPESCELKPQLEQSKKLVHWLGTAGTLASSRQSSRAVLTANSIQLAMDHHAAIVALAENNQRASLLSLIRAIYEAYIYGAWSLYVATDDQLAYMSKGKTARVFDKMVLDLDKKGFFDRQILRDMKPLAKRMDGFLNGSFEHYKYPVSAADTDGRYPDKLIAEALQIADLFAVMACMEQQHLK